MDVQSKERPSRAPAYIRGLNLAEIHVPYVHYSDEPRDPELQLPEDLLLYVYRSACKAAARCRRQCGATLLARKDKSTLASGPSSPVSPISPRSSMSSYFPAPPSALTEDARFILVSSSPLNTLLVPTHDPTFSLPRYTISRSVDSPSRGWISATMKGGEAMARVEIKPGSSKGAVLCGGLECPLKTFMSHGDPNCLHFFAQELHSARFTWTRDPASSDLKCLVHPPSHPLPTVAATFHVCARASDHPTLVVRPDALDQLDMILLTLLIVESCWPFA